MGRLGLGWAKLMFTVSTQPHMGGRKCRLCHACSIEIECKWAFYYQVRASFVKKGKIDLPQGWIPKGDGGRLARTLYAKCKLEVFTVNRSP